MWFKRFRSGDYNIKDNLRPGRPTNINLDSLESLIETALSLTSREVATTLGCSHSTILSNWFPILDL